MEKIVFLVGYYYPKAMANGICVGALATELVKQKHEVHVICLKNGDELQDELINGVDVHRIKPSLYRSLELSRNTNSKKCNLILRLCTLFIKLVHIPTYPMTSCTQVNSYVKEASKLIDKDTVVVSCFNPMEAIVAGMRLKKKHPEIKSIGYYLDSLSNEGDVGILPKKMREKLGLRWEKKLFSVSDCIILMQCHYKHYEKSAYSLYRNKICYADIPLLSIKESITKTDSKRVVYTGMLSVERRNPEYACEVLGQAMSDYLIEFYGRGDCDKILDRFSEKNGGNVINKGFVDHSVAMSAIDNADILLSIGNKDSDMIPSKIFEYISTGKKIIHFAYDKRDACLPYLSTYPLALVLYDGNNILENVKKCEEFVSNNGLKFDANSIATLFEKNLPKYTANIICNREDT